MSLMTDTPDIAPNLDGQPPAKPVSIDPRLALGLGLGCMVVGMFVMWKIQSKRPHPPCPECQQTRFVQAPVYQAPVAQPTRPAPGPQYAPAPPDFQDPRSDPQPQPGGPVPGTLVFSPHVTTGPGPKLADPPPGFNNGAVPEGGPIFA